MITGKNTNHKGGAEMTDYTKDQFISELAIFATAWVDEKMIYESNSEKRNAYSSVLYDVLMNNEQ